MMMPLLLLDVTLSHELITCFQPAVCVRFWC